MQGMTPRRMITIWMLGLACTLGCNSPLMRSPTPDTEQLTDLTDPEDEDLGVQLIGDETVPAQLGYVKVQGVGFVNGLAGTGSDPAPSGLRASLIGEMQSHDVPHPAKLLASKNNALVVVKGWLAPAVQKGDRFDVEVVIPAGSKTTSLRGGHLLMARLREMRELNHAVHTSNVLALAKGDILVASIFAGNDDDVLKTQGLIMGGGVARTDRTLGLVLRPDDASTRESARLSNLINTRFHGAGQEHGSGVAKPLRDNYIELTVQSRYKHNLARYVRVLRSIAVRETPTQRAARLDSLERRLMEPTSAARAALQLEALGGGEAAASLRKGLLSDDTEVRFYAAEALAYLDQEGAADVLEQIARDEPAFRWHALTALAAMDHVSAYEALINLLHVPSVETRYGAFQALRTRNPADPIIRGETLGRDFSYHVVDSDGPPMVHFSTARRCEIVVFGSRAFDEPPAVLFAGRQIMIKGLADGRMKVSRFGLGSAADHEEVIPANVDDLIRAIAKMGGGYAEVLQALRDAKKSGYLPAKVVVGTGAGPGRRFRRDADEPDESSEESRFHVANPLPDLFSNRLNLPATQRKNKSHTIEPVSPRDDSADSSHSFMGRMTGWLSP